MEKILVPLKTEEKLEIWWEYGCTFTYNYGFLHKVKMPSVLQKGPRAIMRLNNKLCTSILPLETYQGCVFSSHDAETKPWASLGYFYNHFLARDDGTCCRIHRQRSLEATWKANAHRMTGKQEAQLNSCSITWDVGFACLIISLSSCQAPGRKGWLVISHSPRDEAG
jgi:hypothetical protein